MPPIRGGGIDFRSAELKRARGVEVKQSDWSSANQDNALYTFSWHDLLVTYRNLDLRTKLIVNARGSYHSAVLVCFDGMRSASSLSQPQTLQEIKVAICIIKHSLVSVG